MTAAARLLDDAADALARPFGMDGAALLRERAEILGIAPDGTVSAGGTCRLLRAGDGRWMAVNLARASDVELLAAWMGHEWDGPVWDTVAQHASRVPADLAVERAQMLGIPAAVAVPPRAHTTGVHVTPGAPRQRDDRVRVLDFSALWAGPLCGRLLAAHGAEVVKVELSDRPDGARAGHPEFWSRLNGAKQEVAVSPCEMARFVGEFDVVITSARPRALEQLHLDLERRVHTDGLVWVAITGYGLTGEWRDRVAFGDDAAVAGGLAVVAGGEDAPVLVGDAPADPLAGLTAATDARALVDAARGGVVDVSMCDVVSAVVSVDRYPASADAR